MRSNMTKEEFAKENNMGPNDIAFYEHIDLGCTAEVVKEDDVSEPFVHVYFNMNPEEQAFISLISNKVIKDDSNGDISTDSEILLLIEDKWEDLCLHWNMENNTDFDFSNIEKPNYKELIDEGEVIPTE